MLRILMNASGIILMLISVMFLSLNIFDGQTSAKKVLTGSAIFLPIVGVMFLLTWEENISYIPVVMFAGNLLIRVFTSNLKFSSIISVFLTIFFVNTMTTAMISILFSLVKPQQQIIEVSVNVISTSVCILLCLSPAAQKIKYLVLWTRVSIRRLILAILFCCCTLSILMVNNTLTHHPGGGMRLLKVLLLSLMLLIFIVLPILMSYSVYSRSIKRKSEEYEKQLKIQLRQYELLSESNKEIRCLKHDYNNLRIGLIKLIKDGKTDEALKMLEDENSILSGSLIKYDTGNGIVDALLTEKQKRAEKSRTRIIFEGAANYNIEPADLCVIFGTTVDNAVEACEKITDDTEKNISIRSVKKAGVTVIVIKNPVSKKIEIQNGMLLTSKKDKKSHGFGLYLLSKVVKKYKGELDISCTDNEFKVCISLLLPDKSY